MKYKKDKTKLLQVRFSTSEMKDLDDLAEATKRTRSEIIRNLVRNERKNLVYGHITQKEAI